MIIKLNRGMRKLIMDMPGVAQDIRRRTNAVAAAAGEGYEAEVVKGRTRPRGSVRTATYEAMRDEPDTRRLTSSLDAGRR